MQIKKILRLTHLAIFLLLLWSCGSDNQVSNSDKEKIEEVSNWEKVIVGKWKYTMLFDKVREKQSFEGEVEYKSDGSYIRTVTIFVHFTSSGEAKLNKGYEDIVSGGTVKGKWKVDKENKLLIEIAEKCTIVNSHVASWANKEYDGCTWFYGESTFGDKQTDERKSELLAFSEKSIKTTTKYFSSDGNLSYEATRQ